MKQFCKRLYLFFTLLFQSIVSSFSVLFFSSFSTNRHIRRINARKDRKQSCVVMGNGPSLPELFELYSDLQADSDCCAVNFFCNSQYFEQSRPTYYILLDPMLFVPEMTKNRLDMIDAFNAVSWKMYLYIPCHFVQSPIVQLIHNENIEIVKYNSTPVEGFSWLDYFFFTHNLGMPMPQTVIIAAIFEMINLDYCTIHLFGVESSWLKYLSIDDENRIKVGLDHFYKGSDVTGEKRTLYEFLISQANAFKGHLRLQRYSHNKKSLILNHTRNSYIDAYQKSFIN